MCWFRVRETFPASFLPSFLPCCRVTLLKRDLEPELEPEQKRLKSEQEPKLTSETNESDSDESHSDKYHGDFFEKYKAREEADKVYREKCRGLSVSIYLFN
jgi:hypothetical protein